MKLDLSKVKYSNNDKRLGITLPTELTEDLAYFMGVHVGDGYMSIKVRPHAVDYHFLLGGHLVNDREWYESVIKPLMKKLFHIDVKVLCKKIVKVEFRSKALITFLHHSCGIIYSPKKNIEAPQIIMAARKSIRAAFLRGVADTDFSMVFRKKGTYPSIQHDTYSETLHVSLKAILRSFGISFYFCKRKRQRYGHPFTTYTIHVYGRKRLRLWMNTVGFYNHNHLTRLQVWKIFGQLPSGTNILERIEMIKSVPEEI